MPVSLSVCLFEAAAAATDSMQCRALEDAGAPLGVLLNYAGAGTHTGSGTVQPRYLTPQIDMTACASAQQ